MSIRAASFTARWCATPATSIRRRAPCWWKWMSITRRRAVARSVRLRSSEAAVAHSLGDDSREYAAVPPRRIARRRGSQRPRRAGSRHHRPRLWRNGRDRLRACARPTRSFSIHRIRWSAARPSALPAGGSRMKRSRLSLGAILALSAGRLHGRPEVHPADGPASRPRSRNRLRTASRKPRIGRSRSRARRRFRRNGGRVSAIRSSTALEQAVAAGNQDLKIAEARFRQARAMIRFNRAAEFPTISTSPSIASLRDSGKSSLFPGASQRPPAISCCRSIFRMRSIFGGACAAP